MRPLALVAPVLIAPLLMAAPARGASPGQQRLQAALTAGQAEALTVTWTIGLPGTETRRVTVRTGSARLSRCAVRAPSRPVGRAESSGALTPAVCTDLGAPTPLTGGQRDRLLSGLRSANLGSLRGAGPDARAAADRTLEVVAGGLPAGQWSLPRAEWPAPASGESEGLAFFLDELGDKLGHAATARQPVPIPRTTADLLRVKLKLRLAPTTRPGGSLLVERGVASVTPEEGTMPRLPRPGPWQHPLSDAEQAQLLAALSAAGLDRLEADVPRREAPAIGDDDGRLATLHLLPPDDGPSGPGAATQPRGLQRFLKDLERSPAGPLIGQLAAILLTPPARPQPPPRSARDVLGRDDLLLSWTDAQRTATVRMTDLPPDARESFRQAVIVAGPYLEGRPRTGERVLGISAPVGKPGKAPAQADHLVGTYGGRLVEWRRGMTSRLCDLLEGRLSGAAGGGANAPEDRRPK